MSEETSSFFQRSPHNAENPWAQISRSLIRDESISPNCRWLLIYLLSMKDGWRVHAKQIYAHVKPHIGRAQVYNAIEEALIAGYMKKEDRFKGNLKQGCTYYVSETPIYKKDYDNSNNFSDVPVSGIPVVGIPKTGKRKESSLLEDTYKDKLTQEEAPGGACVRAFGKFVKLPEEAYKNLCKDHTEEVVKDMIDQINDYLASTGKKPYKDYAAAIRQWIRRRKESPQQTHKTFSVKNPNIQTNRNYFFSVNRSYPGSYKNAKLVEKGVLHALKDYVVVFDQEPKSFIDQLHHIFGVRL